MGSFYFKKFSVRQTSSAMKVNTDGVLLPAWVSLPDTDKGVLMVLDIGTGTGVISLIIAQRLSEKSGSFQVDAIDIDKDAAYEAKLNFENSPWSSRLSSEHISLQELVKSEQSDTGSGLKRYSLIVSNPPFFTNSLKSPSQRKTLARHNCELPFSDLLSGVVLLLEPNGIFAVVLPSDQAELLISTALDYGLYPCRLCRIKTLAGKRDKRCLIEFSKNEKASLIEEALVMQIAGGVLYTPEYCSLVGDYYLKEFSSTKSSD